MWYHTCLVAESVEVIGWCVWHHMAICKVSGGGLVVCGVGGGWGGSGGQTWGLGVVGAKSRWRDWFKRGLGMIAMGVIC